MMAPRVHDVYAFKGRICRVISVRLDANGSNMVQVQYALPDYDMEWVEMGQLLREAVRQE